VCWFGLVLEFDTWATFPILWGKLQGWTWRRRFLAASGPLTDRQGSRLARGGGRNRRQTCTERGPSLLS
jgi:hypothetical protein